METIYLLQRLMERHRGDQKALHMAFINLEAYDSVSREMLLKNLARRGVSVRAQSGNK